MSLQSRITALAQAMGADIKSLQKEHAPVLTYAAGLLTRVDYASGHYKALTYTSGVLTQLDFVQGAITLRKTFTYNPDSTLAGVTESTF